MSYTIMPSTHLTYQMTLTVNVNVNADKALLFLIACVAYGFWQVRRWFYAVSLLVRDFTEAVTFTATVVAIGWKALLFGLGGERR